MGENVHHSGHMVSAATSAKNIRALKITSILTGVYFVIELAIDIFSGSVAVLSDSFHTFFGSGGVFTCLGSGSYSNQTRQSIQNVWP